VRAKLRDFLGGSYLKRPLEIRDCDIVSRRIEGVAKVQLTTTGIMTVAMLLCSFVLVEIAVADSIFVN
jgi:hypothetical protein